MSISKEQADEIKRLVRNALTVDVDAYIDSIIGKDEPVAWQDTANPSVIIEHDQLDPMWKNIMRPLYPSPQPPTPPHECKTDDEKRAFCFGWWKALETVQRKPMTDEEMLDVCVSGKVGSPTSDEVALIRAVERFYKIGGEV
jgi:hypothetical protein